MVNEDHIADRIAQKLRDAEFGCEILNLLPAGAAVLRRDRILVILALILLTVLAWSYLLWLAADMSMDGMDMTLSPRGGLSPAQEAMKALRAAGGSGCIVSAPASQAGLDRLVALQR